jgi:hypothetical protein
VAETSRLFDAAKENGNVLSTVKEQRLRSLLRTDVGELRIDSAWELTGALKRELLFLGDEHYVWTQLEHEVGPTASRAVGCGGATASAPT